MSGCLLRRHSLSGSPSAKFPGEVPPRNKERIFLQDAADTDHRTRPYHDCVVVTPDTILIRTRFEFDEIFIRHSFHIWTQKSSICYMQFCTFQFCAGRAEIEVAAFAASLTITAVQ
jgi:hypothetical protein